MCHIGRQNIDLLETEIRDNYETRYYIIACENDVNDKNATYDHFHFMVEFSSSQEYHNFCQKIFKTKFDLKGQAGRKGTKDEGRPKQYGKVSKIKEVEKACSYTVKSCVDFPEFLRTNMGQEDIKIIMEKSFKKKDRDKQIIKLLDILEKGLKDKLHSLSMCSQNKIDNILGLIYETIIDKDFDISMSKTSINSLFEKFVRSTSLLNLKQKAVTMMIFNRHQYSNNLY